MGRMVRPDVTKLEISGGDWLLVKKRLTAGETRKIFARMVKTMTPGEKIEVDPLQVGRSQAVEYLVDWSFVELPIRGKSSGEIGDAMDLLDMESFNEVVQAIGDHEKRMEDERTAEKNVPADESTSPAISSSAA